MTSAAAKPIPAKAAQLDKTQVEVQAVAAAEVDPDHGFVELRAPSQKWMEFALMCLCNIAWTVDASILPIFFVQFQTTFHASQTSLSLLSTVKGWTAALFAFPCGFLGEMLPRPRLIGLGMVFWAGGLTLCGFAWNFEVLMVGRVLNGMGLGIVQPLLMSLLADKTAPTRRGFAFGSLFFVGAVCNTVFSQVATTFAETTIAGIVGWRASIFVVAAFSALVGLSVAYLVIEPNAEVLVERRKEYTFVTVFTKNLPKVRSLFSVPTFVLILCQGAPGTAPWTVFPFFTQWLELSCFTLEQTGAIWSAFGWGTAFSSLFSGALLNFVSRRFPDHGPPTIANFSVASGIPFLLLFFFFLPKPDYLGDGSPYVPSYAIAFLVFGSVAAMCGTVNKKIFADIVPAEIFTYVFAIDQLVENAVGNFAQLAVGLVTDKVFHYDVSSVKEGSCSPENSAKLGKSMFVVCNVAWAICFSVYLGLHCTYPKDRRRQLTRQTAALKAGPTAVEPVASDADDESTSTVDLPSEDVKTRAHAETEGVVSV